MRLTEQERIDMYKAQERDYVEMDYVKQDTISSLKEQRDIYKSAYDSERRSALVSYTLNIFLILLIIYISIF